MHFFSIELDGFEMDSRWTQNNLVATIISHICKNGQLCGLVKKYGKRQCDPICDKVVIQSKTKTLE